MLAVVPTRARPGAVVTISGAGFDPDPGDNAVSFDGTAARVTAAGPTSLTVTVPEGTTSSTVTVATPAGSATSARPFTVDDAARPLAVTGVSPTVGRPGTVVTITGTGFAPSPGANTVVSGRTRATVTAASGNSLTAVVPAAAGSGPVVVTTDGR
jgi:hypothetical protein